MLLTLNSNFFRPFGIEGEIEKSIEAGFRSIDLNLCQVNNNVLFFPGKERHIANIKRILASGGAVIHQTHAPFPSYREGEDEYNKLLKERTLQAIEISAELGARQVIVHPIHYRNATKKEQLERNLELYAPYGALAKKCGIKIAIENMWAHHRDKNDRIVPNVCSDAEELCTYLDALGDGYTICLDLGHAGLVGEAADKMILAIGKERLGALHVHDNDFYHDSHTAPFLGDMNWDAITDALAAIGYEESFTFEVDGDYLPPVKELRLPAAKYLLAIGEYLVGEIERKKQEKT